MELFTRERKEEWSNIAREKERERERNPQKIEKERR